MLREVVNCVLSSMNLWGMNDEFWLMKEEVRTLMFAFRHANTISLFWSFAFFFLCYFHSFIWTSFGFSLSPLSLSHTLTLSDSHSLTLSLSSYACNATETCERYTTQSHKWDEKMAPMQHARHSHTATLASDGSLSFCDYVCDLQVANPPKTTLEKIQLDYNSTWYFFFPCLFLKWMLSWWFWHQSNMHVIHTQPHLRVMVS